MTVCTLLRSVSSQNIIGSATLTFAYTTNVPFYNSAMVIALASFASLLSSSFSFFPANNSFIEMSDILHNGLNNDESGIQLPFSHFETDLFVIPSFSANPS